MQRCVRCSEPRAWRMLPLAVWPGLERPFSLPKLIWLVRRHDRAASAAVGARVGIACAGWRPRGCSGSSSPAWRLRLPSLEALALGLAAPLFALALTRTQRGSRDAARRTGRGRHGVRRVALAQWVGADPFVLAGWQPPIDGASVRMRVYGTLGNPNFVGVADGHDAAADASRCWRARRRPVAAAAPGRRWRCRRAP